MVDKVRPNQRAAAHLLLAIDRFEIIDLGEFANGVAFLVVVFAILAFATNAIKEKNSA